MRGSVTIAHQTVLVESLPAALVTAVAVPDAAAFTALTVKVFVFPTAQTPTVTITQSAPGVGELQVRIRGYGPRDEWREEISPLVGITAKTTNHVYFGSLFKRVTEVAYIASGMSVGATIAVGCVNDLARANTGSVQHVGAGNLGFWIPGQRGSRKDPGSFELGEFCDPNEPDVRCVGILNRTKSRQWLPLAGFPILGFSELGWAQADDKIGFDFSKVEDGFGGVPDYALTDSIEIYLTTTSPE